MSTYTMELNRLINMGFNIFDDSWETYVPEHKQVLCDKIVRAYWFYEIGQETPDRFKHYLNEQLARIMPYYNQLYQSELLKLEPLYNHYLDSQGENKTKGTRSGSEADRREHEIAREIKEALNRLIKTQGNLTGVYTGNRDQNWTEHKDGSQDITGHETDKQVTDATTDETISETDKETIAETDKQVYSSEKDTATTTGETMNDTLNGTKDTTTSSTTTTSNTRRYSDTPQGTVATSGVEIDKSYLTNYTAENGSSTTQGTAKETLKNVETKQTDTTSTTKETMSSTEDITKNTTRDLTKSITDNTDFDQTVDTTKDTTENTTYTEDKNGTDKVSSKNDTTEDRTGQHDEDVNTLRAENVRDSEIGVKETQDQSLEDTSRKDQVKGFTVSQSELLIAYRKTFLNIDQLIINELAENFMGVF